jgi:hypothetical protein
LRLARSNLDLLFRWYHNPISSRIHEFDTLLKIFSLFPHTRVGMHGKPAFLAIFHLPPSHWYFRINDAAFRTGSTWKLKKTRN